MLVTALSPVIGYDKASAIAHKAYEEDLTLKESALNSGYVDELHRHARRPSQDARSRSIGALK
jgi:fumarate hydratase class II